MALKAIIDSVDGVEYASLYKKTEIDGKPAYVLDVESDRGYALENVGGLKSALEKTKSEHQKARSALDGFKDLDAATVRDQLAELDRLRKSGTDDEKVKQLLESTKAQLARKHKQEIDDTEAKAGRYLSMLDETMRKQVAMQAITEAGGNATLLLPHVLSQTKMREDSGRFVVDVVGGDGIARIKDANSNMGIADLVAEMRNNQAYAVAFSGTNKSGSGSSTGSSGSSVATKFGGTLAEKVAYTRSKVAARNR